jgi:hypothetical protein
MLTFPFKPLTNISRRPYSEKKVELKRMMLLGNDEKKLPYLSLNIDNKLNIYRLFISFHKVLHVIELSCLTLVAFFIFILDV